MYRTLFDDGVVSRVRAEADAPRFDDVVTGSTFVQRIGGLWRRHPVLAGIGALGFVLAAVCAVVAARNGAWLLEPEGRLLEALKFDVAVGMFVLTLGLILPLAPMTANGRTRWAGCVAGLTLYAYVVENVQAWRGLDPRFSDVAGAIDRVLGGIFFLQALALLGMFVILMRSFERDDALPDQPGLRLSFRYATAGALIAFSVGIVMSVISGRATGAGADLMPIHAAGFHSLQAIPLIALLLGTVAVPVEVRRLTHIGGAGWLLLCAGMVIQAIIGQPPLAPTVALAVSAVGATVWSAAIGYAMAVRVLRSPALA